jgi:hypothetical protein
MVGENNYYGNPDRRAGTSRLFLNNGAGTFTEDVSFEGNGIAPELNVINSMHAALRGGLTEAGSGSPFFADFDGDGDVDLISGSSVYLNNHVGSFVQTDSSTIGNSLTTSAITFADVDGDGNLDLIVGNGDNYLVPPPPSPPPRPPPQHPSYSNWNYYEGPEPSPDNARLFPPNDLYLGDGAGHFRKDDAFDGGRSARVTPETRSVAHADVNGDGAVDILFGHNAAAVELYLNNGDATFSIQSIGEPSSTSAIGLADID